jgi:hypothetical protein
MKMVEGDQTPEQEAKKHHQQIIDLLSKQSEQLAKIQQRLEILQDHDAIVVGWVNRKISKKDKKKNKKKNKIDTAKNDKNKKNNDQDKK